MAQHSNWICPQCGNPNISGDLIECPRCGKKRNRWGYWDCRYCGTKSIRADHKECLNCGHARDRNVKFYLRDDLVEFVDEVSGQDAVRIRRPNWICPYCNQQNDDSVNVCVYCNASRSESTERYHDVAAPNQPEPQPQKQKKQRKQKPWKPRKHRWTRSSWFILTMLYGSIFGIVFLILGVKMLVETVSSRRTRTADTFDAYWKCDIYVEKCRTFWDSDWELPEYGRLLETRVEDYTYIDHYERRSRQVWVDDPVYDDDDDDWGGGGGGGGWEDYGDGQFGIFRLPPLTISALNLPPVAAFHYETEWYDEPVYKTVPRDKFYYEYDAWVYSRTVSTTGSGDTVPYFGTVSFDDMERESERTTRYLIDFTSFKEEQITLSVPEALYQQIADSTKLKYRRDITNGKADHPEFILIVDGEEYPAERSEPDYIPDTRTPVYENGDAYRRLEN